jgi:hypothetical protein
MYLSEYVFLIKEIVCIEVLFKTSANISWDCIGVGFCEAFYCERSITCVDEGT